MTGPLSRRHFLQGVSALGAATAVGACRPGGAGRAGDPSPANTTTTSSLSNSEGILVVVTLYGGNDALNTVAPVNDPLYRSLRASLAIDPAAAHDVGEGLALHPALGRCKDLWDEGHLALVHGVGFDGLDRSHFHCMDVWQAGGDDDVSTGWVGRWLDVVATGPLDAVAVGRGLPLLARGHSASAAVIPSGPFALPGGDALHDLLERLSEVASDRSPLGELVARSTADLLSIASTVTPLMAGTPAAETLTARFDTVATLIDAGLPTRLYALDLGGFDTHANQAATHDELLSELDEAVGGFLARMSDRSLTVLIYSEFGRRVVPNASAGTDHGSAGTVLVAGTVRPGHHGEPPPLDRLVEGDLATTVDFRSVYAGLLEGVLGIDADDVLTGSPTPLKLI